MEKKNLIMFYIVGKCALTRDYRILRLTSTDRGWIQTSLNEYDLCRVYESNEKLNVLLEWFRLDFSQYRMFEEEADAWAHLASKTTAGSPARP